VDDLRESALAPKRSKVLVVVLLGTLPMATSRNFEGFSFAMS